MTGAVAIGGQEFLADSLVGHEIGGCRLESVLGRGGMGVVYRGTQAVLERRVAVKFVDAPSLAELLRGGPLRPRRVAAILRDIAWALDAARAIEVLHREVRPWHVFLEPTAEGERAVLTGFGLTAPDLLHGSAREVPPGYEYAAPEVLRGEPVTARSDIYSLGTIAARALGGGRAYARLLGRAMAERPADRFASAGAFATALTAAVA